MWLKQSKTLTYSAHTHTHTHTHTCTHTYAHTCTYTVTCVDTQDMDFLTQSLELLKKGSWGMLPWKILKVETKICAVWGILQANLKKSSTLKFIMNISFLFSICIPRSIILIFIEKKYACQFFLHGKYFVLQFSIFISTRILVSAMNSRLCDSKRVFTSYTQTFTLSILHRTTLETADGGKCRGERPQNTQ